MNLRERKVKYGTKQSQQEGIKFNFDISIMNSFCSYCLSENASIHRSALANLMNIFNKIDESIFENAQECIIRYRFCKTVLDIRLVKKLNRKDLIIRSAYGIIGNNFESLDPNNFDELSNNDVHWVEEMISSCMNIIFINNEIYDLNNMCSEFIGAPYANKMAMANNIKEKVNTMQTQFRRNEIEKDTDQTFKLSNLGPAVEVLLERKKRPSHKLRTGMQGFNDILGGGFEGEKVYCYFALSGEGKTVTLLNLLSQLKKYNTDYICKDPTKKPCIVLLTMENTWKESLETLFNLECSQEDMGNFTKDEIVQLFMSSKFTVTNDSPIDIIVKYKPINSVDTSYLYKLTEDLEDEGYEVICMVQDYIKRIRPVERNGEVRFDLGGVINDFRNYSIYKDVPVITASQLNREAARIIDELRNSNKNELVVKLGRANIGESSLIDENLDATIFLTPEFVGDQKYMGVKITKHRYKIFTKIVSFYQPFEKGSEIKLAEDEGLIKPVFKESLIRDSEEIRKAFGDTVRFSVNREIKDIDDLERDEGRILTAGTVYGDGKKEAAFTPFTIPMFTKIVERIPMQNELIQIVKRVPIKSMEA